MTRDPNATQAEEFNLVAPEVFTENLINVENIHLDGQKYEQTIHQYSLLISQKQGEIANIIKNSQCPSIQFDKRSVNASRTVLSDLQQQFDSFQASVSAFEGVFAPLSVVTNIETNQRRLEIAKKLQRLSAWSSQLSIQYNFLTSEDKKTLPDILRFSQLSSMILQEIDDNFSRITYCANIKAQVLAKRKSIENMVESCLSKTPIKSLTIQDIFSLVLIFPDPAPLFKNSLNIKKRLKKCKLSNFKNQIPSLLSFDHKIHALQSLIPAEFFNAFYKEYKKCKKAVEIQLLSFYQDDIKILKRDIQPNESFVEYQRRFFAYLAQNTQSDSIMDQYFSQSNQEKRRVSLQSAGEKLYKTFRTIAQSNIPSTTSPFKFEFFTESLTEFCNSIIRLLGSKYFDEMFATSTDAPPTIISLFENNFFQLYPFDEKFMFNILEHLLPIFSSVYSLNPNGEIGRIGQALFSHSLFRVMHFFELKFSLTPPKSTLPRGQNFQIDLIFPDNFNMIGLFEELFNYTISENNLIPIPDEIKSFMEDYPNRIIKDLYVLGQENSIQLTNNARNLLKFDCKSKIPGLSSEEALRELIDKGVKAQAKPGRFKKFYSLFQ